VTAYAPDTLRFRWRIAGDALSSPGNCGAVLCLPTENGLAGRDWLTGAERWRVAGHNFAQPIPDGLLLTYGADEVNHAILSERTGRVLGDVGTGQAAADPTAGTVAVFTRTRSPAGRTAIARLDPRTGELFPLGTIDSVIDGLWCQLRGERLACATTTGRLVVTAVG